MHKTVESKIKRCRTCRGTGKIRVCNEFEHHNMDVETCPDCKGDGTLVLIKSLEYFRKTDELINLILF